MRYVWRVFRNMRKLFLVNPLLFLILILAASVRFIGLMPNDIYNADEAYIRDHSGSVFYQIVTKGDFDPHTYKYGSFIFYLGSLSYVPYMLGKYTLELFQVIFFPVGTDERFITFHQFIEQAGAFHDVVPVIFFQRVTTAILGILTVYLVFITAEKLFHKKLLSYVAALFISVAPLHVRDSHYLTTDIPFTLFMLLAVYAMVQLIQTGRMKWYVWTGLALGFSTTIRYFPIGLVAYPLAVLLDQHKTKLWLLKIVNGCLYILIGVAIGVPFLIVNAETNIPLFVDEMNKYVLPWYQTGISSYLFSLVHYVASFGNSELPPLSLFVPHNFQATYITLLLFHGYGTMPIVVSLAGIVVGIVRYPKRTVFLLITPLILFFYISYYIAAKYDRLAIPILPFLALFAGIFIEFLWSATKKNTYAARACIVAIAILVSIYPPLTNSFSASIDCSRQHPYGQSVDWIDRNIPENTTIATQIPLPFPSEKTFNTFDIRPDRDYFLEESRARGAEYTFINTSTLLYFMGTVREDFIIPPPELYDNYFVNLGLYEYQTRAELLHAITAHEMCAHPHISYFKLPPALPEASNLIRSYSFDEPDDVDHWHFQEYKKSTLQIPKISFQPDEGASEKGAISIDWLSTGQVPPRIMSEKIPVVSQEVYTIKGSIKITETVDDFIVERGIGERDGFLRIDFYTSDDADTSIPGDVIALTPRTYGEPDWRTVSVTVAAPEDAVFALISLQASGTKPYAQYMFDDVKLYRTSDSLVQN